MRAFRPFLTLALFGILAFFGAVGLWGMAGSSERAFSMTADSGISCSAGRPECRLVAADAGELTYPPAPCSNPCIIEFSPGGVMDLFAAEGRQLAADHTPVIVDGPCLSACTILVDLARANVCVTRNAVLGYHQGMKPGDDGSPTFEQIDYKTPGLNAYIKAHGGLPQPDSGHMLMLNFAEASAFYRPCAGAGFPSP